MIPRCVKIWLFLYGLFFGVTIGGTLAFIGAFVCIFSYLFFALVGSTLFFMFLIDWRYKKTLEKWLPFWNQSIFDFLKGKKKQ